jgi:uncharacterized cupredoxin-like copper-binding protein
MALDWLEELSTHAYTMRIMPDSQHAEPNLARLRPGQRSRIIWQVDSTGTVHFACLIRGHMEAGMLGEVNAEQLSTHRPQPAIQG